MKFIRNLLLVAVVCLVIVHFMPTVTLPHSDAILAAVTFLFSVIYGFEISIVINNFSVLKVQLATENAQLLSIYHIAHMLGGDEGQKTVDAVENYLLKAIDVPLENHLVGTNKEFFEIFDPLKSMATFKDQRQMTSGQYLTEALLYFPQSRNQVAEVAPRFIGSSVWVMLVLLAVILVGIIFIGASAGFLPDLVAAIFSATVIGTLLLLDEIDSNRIQEAHLEYMVFNETLQAMGKLPYAPESAVKKGIVRFKKGTTYRMGKFSKQNPNDRIIEIVSK